MTHIKTWIASTLVLLVTTERSIEHPSNNGGSESLYSVLHHCYINASRIFPQYEHYELFQRLEPMLAFLNRSYNQWNHERLLEKGLVDQPIFETFVSSVLPKLESHCRDIEPSYQRCLLDKLDAMETPNTDLIKDRVTRLSTRYCQGRSPKQDVMAELERIYQQIGDLYDILPIGPRADNSLRDQILITECEAPESLPRSLKEVTQEDDPLMRSLRDAELTILNAVRCYARVLDLQRRLSYEVKQIMIYLTALLLNINTSDVQLLENESQTRSTTTWTSTTELSSTTTTWRNRVDEEQKRRTTAQAKPAQGQKGASNSLTPHIYCHITALILYFTATAF